jgi:DNA polymerase-3 subunit epsilon
MAQVDVDVEEALVADDHGRVVNGLKLTCTRCSHEVEVFGREMNSVKRGCAMLRDECPLGERNFYVGCAPEQKAPFINKKAAAARPALAPPAPYAPAPLTTPAPTTPPAWLSGDQPMYLFFDTETTGVPAGADNIHMVQLAWILADDNQEIRAQGDFIIRPEGFTIPDEVAKIHGISQARANTEGRALDMVLCMFTAACYLPIRIVGHNVDFDLKVVRKEYQRLGWEDPTFGHETLCTMRAGTDLCMIEKKGGGFKFPKLNELYRKLFNEDFEDAHNAKADIAATARCFWELRRMGRI